MEWKQSKEIQESIKKDEAIPKLRKVLQDMILEGKLNKSLKLFLRVLSELVFGTRKAAVKCIKEIARETRGKRILEIGSGKKVNGKYPYSCHMLFKEDNHFIMSDVNPSFGHRAVDVTRMDFKEEYGLILCLNVLEHVYDFEKAVNNMRNALKRGGIAAVFVPYLYPLHDEPIDFFRYSEHALRRMFSRFRDVRIRHFGLRHLPTAYFLTARK